MNETTQGQARAAGSALAICLVLLAALTAVGVALASVNHLQRRIQSNEERAAAARDNAEVALAEAERWLFQLANDTPPVACVRDCVSSSPAWSPEALPDKVQHLDPGWWRTHARQAELPHDEATGHGGAAYWMVVEMAPPGALGAFPDTTIARYRLLGLGADAQLSAYAVTESLLARPWTVGNTSDSESTETSVREACRRLVTTPCGRTAWRRLR